MIKVFREAKADSCEIMKISIDQAREEGYESFDSDNEFIEYAYHPRSGVKLYSGIVDGELTTYLEHNNTVAYIEKPIEKVARLILDAYANKYYPNMSLSTIKIYAKVIEGSEEIRDFFIYPSINAVLSPMYEDVADRLYVPLNKANIMDKVNTRYDRGYKYPGTCTQVWSSNNIDPVYKICTSQMSITGDIKYQIYKMNNKDGVAFSTGLSKLKKLNGTILDSGKFKINYKNKSFRDIIDEIIKKLANLFIEAYNSDET